MQRKKTPRLGFAYLALFLEPVPELFLYGTIRTGSALQHRCATGAMAHGRHGCVYFEQASGSCAFTRRLTQPVVVEEKKGRDSETIGCRELCRARLLS